MSPGLLRCPSAIEASLEPPKHREWGADSDRVFFFFFRKIKGWHIYITSWWFHPYQGRWSNLITVIFLEILDGLKPPTRYICVYMYIYNILIYLFGDNMGTMITVYIITQINRVYNLRIINIFWGSPRHWFTLTKYVRWTEQVFLPSLPIVNQCFSAGPKAFHINPSELFPIGSRYDICIPVYLHLSQKSTIHVSKDTGLVPWILQVWSRARPLSAWTDGKRVPYIYQPFEWLIFMAKTCGFLGAILIFYHGESTENLHVGIFCCPSIQKQIQVNQYVHNWVVVSNIFYVHPYLGKRSNLTNIFQMGWNHQLDEQFSWILLWLTQVILTSPTIQKHLVRIGVNEPPPNISFFRGSKLTPHWVWLEDLGCLGVSKNPGWHHPKTGQKGIFLYQVDCSFWASLDVGF